MSKRLVQVERTVTGLHALWLAAWESVNTLSDQQVFISF
jgi:hypothetical protein